MKSGYWVVLAPLATALACNSLIDIDKDYRLGTLAGGGGGAGVGAAAGGPTGGTGGAGGGGQQCADASECGQDTTCRQYTCNGTCGVQNAAAGTACTEDGGTVCDGNGNCVPVGCTDGMKNQEETDVDCGGPDCGPCPNGSDCLLPSDCESGFCPAQDGNICCNSACDGFCRACTAENSGAPDGTCAYILAGKDPDGECPVADEACDGAGMCGSCGIDPPPPGSGCPAACDGGCNGGTCTVACDLSNECNQGTITCPAGFACDVQCTNNSACEEAVIHCPDTYACTVNFATTQAGKNATVNCSSGSCAVTCSSSNQSCLGTVVNCGTNACSATCLGTDKANVICGQACACSGC